MPRRQRIQCPLRHSDTATRISRHTRFFYVFQVESPNIDTAGTIAAAQSVRGILIARFYSDNEPKVFECVVACRRITCNIQTGLKIVNVRRQTR
jgi:hypothetical protein